MITVTIKMTSFHVSVACSHSLAPLGTCLAHPILGITQPSAFSLPVPAPELDQCGTTLANLGFALRTESQASHGPLSPPCSSTELPY